jgi:hypothetical protein
MPILHWFPYQHETSGDLVDLTATTMRMGIRRRAADGIDNAADHGKRRIIITDAINGKFTVFISHTQLQELPLGEYEHSLIRIAEGMHLRIWSGSLTNNPGASR